MNSIADGVRNPVPQILTEQAYLSSEDTRNRSTFYHEIFTLTLCDVTNYVHTVTANVSTLAEVAVVKVCSVCRTKDQRL